MVLHAHVTHGSDGYRLHVQEVPLRRLIRAWAAENILTPATFHLFRLREVPEMQGALF